jgi:hypothetical protein
MPAKKTKGGQQYAIDGKTFVWTSTEADVEIRIPMRLKLKTIRAMSGRNLDDLETMFDLLDAVAPGQDAELDELDVNEFQAMFDAWQTEYNALSGATLGEASSSPA